MLDVILAPKPQSDPIPAGQGIKLWYWNMIYKKCLPLPPLLLSGPIYRIPVGEIVRIDHPLTRPNLTSSDTRSHEQLIEQLKKYSHVMYLTIPNPNTFFLYEYYS